MAFGEDERLPALLSGMCWGHGLLLRGEVLPRFSEGPCGQGAGWVGFLSLKVFSPGVGCFVLQAEIRLR